MPTLSDLRHEIRFFADPARAKATMSFFKTKKGEYGHGDTFLGLTVPLQRQIAKRYPDLPLADMLRLLESPVHEERLISLFLLIRRFEKGDEKTKKEIFQNYRKRIAKHVNNWDLIDTSAPYLLGKWLLAHPDPAHLTRLATSRNLWEKRAAILATFAFIRAGKFDEALRVSELLIHDSHDLIHKAVGWMLREVGKKDKSVEEVFLRIHSHEMPRTMLRYAIEKFPEGERKKWMAMKSKI